MRLCFLQGWATRSQIFQRFLFPFWHHKNWIFRRVYHTMCYPSACWTFQTQRLKVPFRILYVALGLLSMFSCFCFSSPCSVFHVVSHLWHLGLSAQPCNHIHIVQIKRLPVRKRDGNICTNPASYLQNLDENLVPWLFWLCSQLQVCFLLRLKIKLQRSADWTDDPFAAVWHWWIHGSQAEIILPIYLID